MNILKHLYFCNDKTNYMRMLNETFCFLENILASLNNEYYLVTKYKLISAHDICVKSLQTVICSSECEQLCI